MLTKDRVIGIRLIPDTYHPHGSCISRRSANWMVRPSSPAACERLALLETASEKANKLPPSYACRLYTASAT